MKLQRADRARVLVRLLFIQAPLHRKGMQNLGVVHAMDAVAPKISSDPRALLARHTDYFNTNPNAAPIVVGGVLRIEEDATAIESVGPFKRVACSALAAMGDVLVVGGLKPLALTLAMVSAIYSFFAGLVAILVLYNGLLIGGRIWGLGFGYTRGWGVVEAFTGPRVQRVVGLARASAAIVGGVLIAVIGRREFADGMIPIGVALAATLGAWLAMKRTLNVPLLAIGLFPLIVVVAMLVK